VRHWILLVVVELGCTHAPAAPPVTGAARAFDELDQSTSSAKQSETAASSPAQREPAEVAGSAEQSEPPPDGSFRWVRSLGGADNLEVLAVAVDTEGAVVVAGGSNRMGEGARTAFIHKLTTTGAPVWQQVFKGKGKVAGVAVDRSGTIIAVGSFTGRLQLGEVVLESKTARSDLFVARLSPQGRVLWGKYFGSAAYETATAVAVDPREIVEFLLSKKADPRHKDKKGKDALDLAKSQN
jgi:hypothetical protein